MAYTVTDTRELNKLTQAGTERKFYRVWLTTANGASGSVDILEKDWTAEQIPDILQVKADSLDLAFTLTGV